MSTYLITGANRGGYSPSIGLAFVAKYLSRPNATVIAAVRDPNHPTAQALTNLSKSSSSTLIVIKIDSTAESDPANAIKQLQSIHNITTLDIVIANAGISKRLEPVSKCTTAGLLEHTIVNVMGPILLFQASLPLLLKSAKPKFMAISSSAGCIGAMERRPYPNAEYGSGKAMLNWIIRKIHLENESIVAIPIDPGWVQTDMGNWGAQTFGMEKAEITADKSVDGMVALIDGATRGNCSGRFMLYNGEETVW